MNNALDIPEPLLPQYQLQNISLQMYDEMSADKNVLLEHKPFGFFQSIFFVLHLFLLLWSSIFVTLMANKIGGLQFGIYRNCQISSRVFHTAVAALPLTKANRSDFE